MVLEIKPRALNILGKCCTSELHPSPKGTKCRWQRPHQS
jgi:hypothetical protein